MMFIKMACEEEQIDVGPTIIKSGSSCGMITTIRGSSLAEIVIYVKLHQISNGTSYVLSDI